MNDDEDRDMKDWILYLSDLRDIANTEAGQRFFVHFFASSGCLQSVHRTNSDVYRMSGVQAFGLRIWRDLHAANPEASKDIFDSIMAPPTDEEQNHED